MLVEVCGNVITTLSKQNNLAAEQLNIRIDLESPIATPVFALFDQSAFLSRCDMKAIIRAGGGAGFEMVLKMQVSGIVQNIFKSLVAELGAESTKDIFLLLYGKQLGESSVPHMAIYQNGVKYDAVPLSDLIGASGNL